MLGTVWAPRGPALPRQPQGIPAICSRVPMFCCWAPQAGDSQVPVGSCRQGAETLGFSLTPGFLQGFAGDTPCLLLEFKERQRGGAGGYRVGGDIPKAVQKVPLSAHPRRRVISKIRHRVLIFPL